MSRLCDIEKPSSIRVTVITAGEVVYDHEEFPLNWNETDEGIRFSTISFNKTSQVYRIDVEFLHFLANVTLHIESESSFHQY